MTTAAREANDRQRRAPYARLCRRSARWRSAVVAAALAVCAFFAGGGSAAAASDFARYILPPGNYGGLPTTDESTDQLPLYDALTYLRGRVTRADVVRYYLPMDFRPVGATRVEPTPNPDVRIVYDAYGIPHITGKTRSALMYGAGWVMARDRRLLLQLGRWPARAAILDIPGVDAFSLVTSATPFEPSAQAEALVRKQRDLILRTYGREGRQLLRDGSDYVRGINDWFRAHGGFPDGKEFTVYDGIAVTAFIGSIFGAGGGSEYRNAMLAAALERRYGKSRGKRIFDDLMLAVDPESPTTTRRRFGYGPLTGGRIRGSVTLDPGSVQLIDARQGPLAPARARSSAVDPPRRRMSNWLLVSPSRSASRRTLAVQGPQLGYFYPEIVYQQELRGPGIHAQGIAAAGLGLYMLIGRTRDYAWSLTSAGHDVRDVYVERLCEPDGSRPTRTSTHYLYKGKCRAMGRFYAGKLAGRDVSFMTTVHGPVIGTATLGGRPVALARRRSTRGREGLNLMALKAMTEGRATTPERFFKIANRFEFTFNWGWASRRATAYFSSGRLPVRARGLDRRLPTLGDGRFEWRGYLSWRQHPHDVGGPGGLLLNWNNQSAPGFMHGDDEHYGSVHRVEMFDRWPRRPRIEQVVGIMNRAATEDLRATRIWPTIRAVMRKGKAPDALAERAAALVDAFARAGGPVIDRDRDGYVDSPGRAILDEAWPLIARAAMADRLGSVLVDQLARTVGIGESAGFGGGWWSYLDKDLRTLLGRRVRGRFAVSFCGRGNVRRCAATLWRAFAQATARLAQSRGPDPSKWLAEAPRIRFTPGLIPNTMAWTNRPTYQHVIEFARR